jgi:hypothetical protein
MRNRPSKGLGDRQLQARQGVGEKTDVTTNNVTRNGGSSENRITENFCRISGKTVTVLEALLQRL